LCRRRIERGISELGDGVIGAGDGLRGVGVKQPPDAGAAASQVPEDVLAVQLGDVHAAVDMPANDRLPVGVGVLGDRRDGTDGGGGLPVGAGTGVAVVGGGNRRVGVGVAVLIVPATAVAQRDVEVSVGPEAQRAAIVVGLRLADAHHDARRGGVIDGVGGGGV